MNVARAGGLCLLQGRDSPSPPRPTGAHQQTGCGCWCGGCSGMGSGRAAAGSSLLSRVCGVRTSLPQKPAAARFHPQRLLWVVVFRGGGALPEEGTL